MTYRRVRRWTEFQYPFAFRQAVITDMQHVIKAQDKMPETYRWVTAPSLHEQMSELQASKMAASFQERKIKFMVFLLSCFVVATTIFGSTLIEQRMTDTLQDSKNEALSMLRYHMHGVIDGVSMLTDTVNRKILGLK
jgi:hypothetical protein